MLLIFVGAAFLFILGLGTGYGLGRVHEQTYWIDQSELASKEIRKVCEQ